jgi:hypothetical protein
MRSTITSDDKYFFVANFHTGIVLEILDVSDLNSPT